MKTIIFLVFVSIFLPYIVSQPDLIKIINPNNTSFCPENVEWNSLNKKFLVGDIYGGKVWQIDDSGTATQFDLNTQSSNCTGTFGLYFSSSTQLNVACGKFIQPPNASLPFQALASIYTSGVLTQQTDLTNFNSGAAHVANDLRTDGNGNLYVTDSFTPQIWKITNGVPSVFLFNHSTFYPSPFLDGIEINIAKNYLIVSNFGNSNVSRLIKIPINNPQSATVVQIDNNGFNAFEGPDGIRFLDSAKTILVTTDNTGPEFRILKLQSNDDWVTAKIIQQFIVPYNNPSGVVVLPGETNNVWYQTANGFTPGNSFVIAKTNFPSSKSSASLLSFSLSIFFFLFLSFF